MLTYCLVTKGRIEFLTETLEALKSVLQFPEVQVVVIDNGCPESVSQIIKSWCTARSHGVKYLRFEINDPTAGQVWSQLKAIGVDWVTFPGDDDLVEAEFISEFYRLLSKEPDVVAIASSLRIIDAYGNQTGEIRNPNLNSNSNFINLAHAFSEPPFLWPGLFFRLGAVNENIPSSRYVLDWWVSLNLVASGRILTSPNCGVSYRVHDGQESALAPSRRKYLEAELWICDFLDSITFMRFIEGLEFESLISFWESARDFGPIYRNSDFGFRVLKHMGTRISNINSNLTLKAKILGDLALICGVLIKPGELGFFDKDLVPSEASNFGFLVQTGSCESINCLASAKKNLGETSSAFNSISIGCKHAKKGNFILIPCNLDFDNESLCTDSVIRIITDKLEFDGVLDFSVSPNEKRLICLIRKLKRSVPHLLVRFLKVIVNRKDDVS